MEKKSPCVDTRKKDFTEKYVFETKKETVAHMPLTVHTDSKGQQIPGTENGFHSEEENEGLLNHLIYHLYKHSFSIQLIQRFILSKEMNAIVCLFFSS